MCKKKVLEVLKVNRRILYSLTQHVIYHTIPADVELFVLPEFLHANFEFVLSAHTVAHAMSNMDSNNRCFMDSVFP